MSSISIHSSKPLLQSVVKYVGYSNYDSTFDKELPKIEWMYAQRNSIEILKILAIRFAMNVPFYRFRRFKHDPQGFQMIAQDGFHHQVYLVVAFFPSLPIKKSVPSQAVHPGSPHKYSTKSRWCDPENPPPPPKTAAFVDCLCIWITPDPQDGEYVQTLTEKLPSIFSAKVRGWWCLGVVRCKVSSDQFTQVLWLILQDDYATQVLQGFLPWPI